MLVFCAICMDNKPLTTLQFLKCGHGFCQSCCSQYIKENSARQPNTTRRQRNYPCPHCRVNFKEVDLHPIYIDLRDPNGEDDPPGDGPRYSEAVTKQARYATEKINSMNGDTPVGSMQRSAREVKKVVDAIEEEGGDVVQALIEAVTLLRDRLTPQLALSAKQKHELVSLKQSLQDREVQIDTLKNDAVKRQRLLENACETAEKAKDKFNAEKHANQSLQKELSNFKVTMKKKEEEMSGLKGSLQKFKEKESRQTARILELKSRVEGLENDVSDLHTENERLKDQVREARLETETQRSAFSESQSLFSSDDELDIISSEPEFDFSRSGPPTPRSQPKKTRVLRSATTTTIPTPSSSQTQPTQPLRTKTNTASTSSRSASASTSFTSISAPPQPQRPKFSSDWAAPNAHLSKLKFNPANTSSSSGSGAASSLKRKRSLATHDDTAMDPVKVNFEKTLGLDRSGRSVSGALVVGDRRKLRLSLK